MLDHSLAGTHGRSSLEDLGDGQEGAHGEGPGRGTEGQMPSWSRTMRGVRCGSGGGLVRGFGGAVGRVERLPEGACFSDRTCYGLY